MSKKFLFGIVLCVFSLNIQSAFANDITSLCDGEVVECEGKLKAFLGEFCDIRSSVVRCDGSTSRDGEELLLCTAMYVEGCSRSMGDQNADISICPSDTDEHIYDQINFKALKSHWSALSPLSVCRSTHSDI